MSNNKFNQPGAAEKYWQQLAQGQVSSAPSQESTATEGKDAEASGSRIGGVTGVTGTDWRFWLERERDQHRIDADSIQALLDALPAKLSPAADSAMRNLSFRNRR